MNKENNSWQAPELAAAAIARQLHRPPLPGFAFVVMALSLDLLTLLFAVWASLVISGVSGGSFLSVLALLGLSLLFSLFGLWLTGTYRLERLRRFARNTPLAIAVALAGVLGALLALQMPMPGAGILVTAATITVGLCVSRAIVGVICRWAADFGLTDRRAILVGGGKEAASALTGLAGDGEANLRVVGLFDDRVDERSPAAVMGVPKLGMIKDVIEFVRSAPIDAVIIAFPVTAEERIRQITDLLRVLPVEVRLSGLASSVAAGQELQNATLVAQPYTADEAMLKRLFDIVFAALALVVLAPIFAAVALAIKLDSKGPVFFCQDRHGYNNKTIRMFKFRSMFQEAEDQSAAQVVTRNDARVTRVGRIIRRSSLDELPQLLNVLWGDISLVGPRPHAVNAIYSETTPFDELVHDYAARHRVPPGITGWAQINGWRGEIDDPERLRRRVECDLFYIENRSVWLDLKILFKTVPALLNTKYAY